MGFLFLILYPASSSTSAASASTLSHTSSFTHSLSHTIFVTHNFDTHTHPLSHTTLSHTICHTPSVTHHLSHTIFHAQLCHTPSLTHNFVTHHLSHTTLSHTPSFFVTHHLSHTTLSHTIFDTQLCHTPSFTHNFVTHTIFLCHTPSFTYNFVHAHTHFFVTFRSSTTSFVLFDEVDLWGYHVLSFSDSTTHIFRGVFFSMRSHRFLGATAPKAQNAYPDVESAYQICSNMEIKHVKQFTPTILP